jgi:hypothetical protein
MGQYDWQRREKEVSRRAMHVRGLSRQPAIAYSLAEFVAFWREVGGLVRGACPRRRWCPGWRRGWRGGSTCVRVLKDPGRLRRRGGRRAAGSEP